jgi:hypothetical protein
MNRFGRFDIFFDLSKQTVVFIGYLRAGIEIALFSIAFILYYTRYQAD